MTPNSNFEVLALCARAVGHPAQAQRLAALTQGDIDWQALPPLAEAHGLAPLLLTHLQAIGFTPPQPVLLQLQGYHLQHAHAAHARLRALSDILSAAQTARLDLLVLKGAALAHLVYPTPALRPMRDIDLLVPAGDVHRMSAMLESLGFHQPEAALPPGHHHQAAFKRTVEGFSVSVEVHHALDLNETGCPPRRYEDLAPGRQTFSVAGQTAAALGREAMLWHVYRHAFGMPLGYEPLRLVWVADLVSLVEAWITELDWQRVRREYGAVYRSLPLLHALTPWSPAVLERLQLPVARLPGGAGHSYQGWTPHTFPAQRPKGLRRILRDTFFPSPWWLRVRYGHGPGWTGYRRAWRAHQRWLWPELGTRAAHLARYAASQWPLSLKRISKLRR